MDGTLAATVKLQDVLNPMISALVTIVNLLVVISSGFILRKGMQLYKNKFRQKHSYQF